jgi:hypothetical protein
MDWEGEIQLDAICPEHTFTRTKKILKVSLLMVHTKGNIKIAMTVKVPIHHYTMILRRTKLMAFNGAKKKTRKKEGDFTWKRDTAT